MNKIASIKSNDVFESALSLIKRDLDNSPFFGQEVSVLSHFLSANEKFPHVRDETFDAIQVLYGKTSGIISSKFKFIDLFAGIGGFRIGLQNFGGKSVFSSEWDKNAQETYYNNHSDYPYGDITKFTNEHISDNELDMLIPSHDVLAGGFPCQPFSRAGVSARNSLGLPHGFECTTQGTLFYSIERITKIKKPKLLFLENVKNILSHDNGQTFFTIRSTIESMGYKFFHSIVNSETLVPQRRVRCFMIGVRQDLVDSYGDFVFPDFSGDSLPLRGIIENNVDDKYTISDKLWHGHITRSERNLARGTGFTTGETDLDKPSNTIVARYGKDGKECLIPQENKNPRMLTINECKKLFGYPESFKLPQFRTPAYKLLGNSVVVPVIERISDVLVKQYILPSYKKK